MFLKKSTFSASSFSSVLSGHSVEGKTEKKNWNIEATKNAFLRLLGQIEFCPKIFVRKIVRIKKRAKGCKTILRQNGFFYLEV